MTAIDNSSPGSSIETNSRKSQNTMSATLGSDTAVGGGDKLCGHAPPRVSVGGPAHSRSRLLRRRRLGELGIPKHFEYPRLHGASWEFLPPVPLDAIQQERTVVVAPGVPGIGLRAKG